MAGTMMKTRRRVKRTVREMPRRLTIRLSKGSSRNMVGDAGQASALLPVNKAGLRWSSPSAPAWGGPIPPKPASLDGWNGDWAEDECRRGPRGPPLETGCMDGGLGPSQPRWGSPASEQPGRALGSALLALLPEVSLYLLPKEHLADKSVLKVCHCQKYQEEFNVLPEKA